MTIQRGLRGLIVCLRQCGTSLGTCRTHDDSHLFHLPGTMPPETTSRLLVAALHAKILKVQQWTTAENGATDTVDAEDG